MAIGENVVIGRNAVLHPHAVIYAGAVIGDDFTAHSHSVVREFCQIGNRVILQNNVVIGGDGFGFAKRADGTHHKIVQSGITVIEDDVEIQSLTSIDRASMGETRVKRGAKIDSLVQVGHNCVVGEDNIICSQTGLAGSSILEKDVLLAGQVGVSGHLTIHEGAIVYAQSGIGGDVPPKAPHVRLTGVRRIGMAARHHSFSETPGNPAQRPRTEETEVANSGSNRPDQTLRNRQS